MPEPLCMYTLENVTCAHTSVTGKQVYVIMRSTECLLQVQGEKLAFTFDIKFNENVEFNTWIVSHVYTWWVPTWHFYMSMSYHSSSLSLPSSSICLRPQVQQCTRPQHKCQELCGTRGCACKRVIGRRWTCTYSSGRSTCRLRSFVGRGWLGAVHSGC